MNSVWHPDEIRLLIESAHQEAETLRIEINKLRKQMAERLRYASKLQAKLNDMRKE